MVGPTLKQQGGMATVENLIMNQPFPSICIHHISSHDEGSLIHRLQVFSSALIKLVLSFLGNNADLIHIHIADKGSVLRKGIIVAVAVLFRKPVIMHTHGCEFHLFFDALPKFSQHLVVWVFQRCKYVITLSESWRNYYLVNCKLKQEQVLLLPNPVELPEHLPDRRDSNRVHFVFMGRIGDRKGAFDLIQAFAKLPATHIQQAELTLAGDGLVEQARELVTNLALNERIYLPGWVSPEQRNQILRSADVFVLPSYNEGLPMAILEAMAWGLPILTTPVGGIPEVITHQQEGFLIEPGNVDQLSVSIQTLIGQENLRLKMGKNARQRVIPFNIDNYYLSLSKIYQSVVFKNHALLCDLTNNSYFVEDTQ